MTDQSAASHVAQIETDLSHYKSKSDNDDEMISLLKRQLELNSVEMTQMAADHANEVRELRLRRDEAVRNETEVTGILNTAAKGIVDGLRKMVGNATPVIAQVRPADHVLLEDQSEDAANLKSIFSLLPVNAMSRR